MLMNFADHPMPELNLTDAQPATLELKLRPKVTTRGRVVDAQGKGIADAFVVSMIANRSDQPVEGDASELESGDGDARHVPPADSAWAKFKKWSQGGSGQTDSDGNYEIEVAAGAVELEVIREGYFSSPPTTETVIVDPATQRLPELVLHSVPALSGRVLDATGQPVIGAIVRMRHIGRGDADPVAESSADGSFHLKLSRIPYTIDGNGLQTDVSVVAMDPKSNRGGIAGVDLKDASSTGEITITLAERSPDWALNVVQHDKSPVSDQVKEQLAARVEQYPEGVAGKTPPDLSEGTWLNTDARSLADFRGRLVLLDFWFIGCGPCERDMPTIKLLHQKFFDQGFSVVSVHTSGQSPESVQKFANENGMNYPVVVDTADGVIMKQYQQLGVNAYPLYMLLDSDGRIIQNDATSMGNRSLRTNMIELIYRELRQRAR